MNTYNVITLFPNLIEEWKNIGIVRQAIKNQLVNIQIFPNDRLNILVQFWDFAKKYNYSEEEVEKIHQNYNNQMLHNASLRSDKKAGRKHYKPFRQPVLRNFVYFLSSQSNMARKFFNLFRKI